MDVEWNPQKAFSNQKKHGVEFEEASTCLLDPNAIVVQMDTVGDESRWVLVGASTRVRLLTVVYTFRGETIRLISARKTTRKEASQYE